MDEQEVNNAFSDLIAKSSGRYKYFLVIYDLNGNEKSSSYKELENSLEAIAEQVEKIQYSVRVIRVFPRWTSEKIVEQLQIDTSIDRDDSICVLPYKDAAIYRGKD